MPKKDADFARLKQTYNMMVKALHPDKCNLEGAGTAFARVQSAYENLKK